MRDVPKAFDPYDTVREELRASTSQTFPVIPPITLSAFKLGAGSKLAQAPDGSEVLETSYGSSASADLGVSPAQLQAYPPGQSPYVREGTYTLSFDVVNSLINYPGWYEVEVDFGNQELCYAEGWGLKTFAVITTVNPGPGYIVIDKSLPDGGPVQSASNLVLHVSTPGWPLYFRNFSLMFTPVN